MAPAKSNEFVEYLESQLKSDFVPITLGAGDLIAIISAAFVCVLFVTTMCYCACCRKRKSGKTRQADDQTDASDMSRDTLDSASDREPGQEQEQKADLKRKKEAGDKAEKMLRVNGNSSEDATVAASKSIGRRRSLQSHIHAGSRDPPPPSAEHRTRSTMHVKKRSQMVTTPVGRPKTTPASHHSRESTPQISTEAKRSEEHANKKTCSPYEYRPPPTVAPFASGKDPAYRSFAGIEDVFKEIPLVRHHQKTARRHRKKKPKLVK